MKYIFIILVFIAPKISLNAQIDCFDYCVDFEDGSCKSQYSIDTSQNNIWQIGKPEKIDLNSSYTYGNVIITDTLQPYQVNNHSEFIIRDIATYGDMYGFKAFVANFYVQTDSLNDYGTVEFSSDRGETWIDLINDTVYNSSITWYTPKPVLTGSSNGWNYFEIMLADNRSVFDIELGDTLLYKFSFHSDGIFDDLAGIAYDNICFYEFVEGISETRFKPIRSKIYPNPVTSDFTIEFENPDFGSFELAIYTIQSEIKLKEENIRTNKVHLNSSSLKPGIYVYKLTNIKDRKRSWGKFIIAE